MLKQYIAREPEVDVAHTSNKNDATIVVARVIYQDTDPELGEVPDVEGYHQKKGSETSNWVTIFLKTSDVC